MLQKRLTGLVSSEGKASVRRSIVSNLLLIGHLTLLFGCSGGQLIPPEISPEPVQLSIIRTNDGGVGFINQAGEVTIKAQFTDAKPFSDGLAAVEISEEDGKKLWGFINHKGEFVIQPKYYRVEPFSDKLAFVWAEREIKPTIIDQRGNVAIKDKEGLRFGLSSGFNDGLAPVVVKGKFGFINTKGEIVIEPKFDSVRSFADGLAFVQVGEGFEALAGYIDQSGRLVVPLEYKGGTDFNQDRALVTKAVYGGYFMLIDKTGKLLKEKVNPACSDSESIRKGFSEGLVPTRLELPNQTGFFRLDACGYIDGQGNAAIAPSQKFEKAQPFSEGLAAVQIQRKQGYSDTKWGYIDKTGGIVIEPIFEEASSFTNGLAYVKVDAAKQGYINRSGQFVWQPVTF